MTLSALITGAGRGIGRAIALMLAGQGYAVGLLARDRAALIAVASECTALGVQAVVLAVDVQDSAALSEAIASARAQLGGLNALVNAAGTHEFASSIDANLDTWDRIIDVNLRAAMHATRLALPHIVASAQAGQPGAVIFISSLGGKFSAPTNAAYSASKHALTGFAGSVFEDVRDAGVKCCTIYPGWVNTQMLADWLDPALAIQPQDIAELVRLVVTFPAHACPTEIVVQPQASAAARLFP